MNTVKDLSCSFFFVPCSHFPITKIKERTEYLQEIIVAVKKNLISEFIWISTKNVFKNMKWVNYQLIISKKTMKVLTIHSCVTSCNTCHMVCQKSGINVNLTWFIGLEFIWLFKKGSQTSFRGWLPQKWGKGNQLQLQIS